MPLPHPTSMRSSAHRLVRPIIEFLHVEAAAGIALLVATAIALLWANLPWSESYHSFWSTHVSLGPGWWTLRSDLHGLVDDGLMALFFFVVGLEIKREWVSGELRDRRAAVLPAAAALGGMVVPALLYTAITLGTGFEHGWGVPMATDIAFAVGVLALLGPRVPTSLRVFVLTLAIVDDIGAIVVIALFYGSDVDGRYLLVALALAALAGGLWHWRVMPPVVPVLIGIGLWMAVYASGIHATIAGVVLGLLVPAGAVAERLERGLHPWVSFGVIPVFALANAGVPLGRAAVTEHPRVLAGVAIGLVAGKAIGVTAGAWVAVRSGAAALPTGVGWGLLTAAAVLTGIGFTVSLFVTGLAFEADSAADAAKIAILTASVVAAVAGALAVRGALPKTATSCICND